MNQDKLIAYSTDVIYMGYTRSQRVIVRGDFNIEKLVLAHAV